MSASSGLRSKLEGCLRKVFPRTERGSKKSPLTLHPPYPTAHTLSTVSVTRVSITMSTTLTSTVPVVPDGGNTNTDSFGTDGQKEAEKLDTTPQVLPTKYIDNVDNLVRVMQAMVGEKGTFQIEVCFYFFSLWKRMKLTTWGMQMRHTSYILRSPIKLDLVRCSLPELPASTMQLT